MLIPQPINTVANAVYKHWQDKGSTEDARPYLGGSALGGPCERALWYGFRWAESKQFDGRLYRLFNRGHREEAVVSDELRGIGCTVLDTQPDGQQWGGSALGGHMRWHMDAACTGLPSAPQTWFCLEVKTHNAKSFKDLEDKGVEKSKPQHYAQMQVYMGQSGLQRALYYAVCKDTDAIHTEWIHFDAEKYAKLMDRAHRVISANEPPMRISQDASWFECKWCDYNPICHGTTAPQVNCRTCAHSTPELTSDALWTCSLGSMATLSIIEQRAGCISHRYIPILLENFAAMKDSTDNNVTYTNALTGRSFTNGDIGSPEIRACQDKRALGENNAT